MSYRIVLAAAVAVAALVPRAVCAQQPDTTARPQQDSTPRPDSTAPKKHGFFGKAVKALGSKNVMKAAATATGVGAVALLMKPGQDAGLGGAASKALVDAATGQSAVPKPSGAHIPGMQGMSTMTPQAAEASQAVAALAMRASTGDTTAIRQYARLQREMMVAAQQGANPTTFMRDAYVCVTTGAGCRTARP